MLAPDSVTVAKQTEFIVTLVLEPDAGEVVNAFSVELVYPAELLTLHAIVDTDSVVTHWIEKRETATGVVSLSGVMRGGFAGVIDPQTAAYKGGVLAHFVFLPRVTGEGVLDLTKLQLLAHNGQGTELPVTAISATVAVTDEVQPTTLPQPSDIEPPAPFTIIRTQDPAVFAGQYFIIFDTHDVGSGISHYEVKEGNGAFVIATSPYVLKDQSGAGLVEVRAVDRAGNSYRTTIGDRSSWEYLRPWHSYALLGALMLLSIVFIIRHRWRLNPSI